jgi:hypothetical protein
MGTEEMANWWGGDGWRRILGGEGGKGRTWCLVESWALNIPMQNKTDVTSWCITVRRSVFVSVCGIIYRAADRGEFAQGCDSFGPNLVTSILLYRVMLSLATIPYVAGWTKLQNIQLPRGSIQFRSDLLFSWDLRFCGVLHRVDWWLVTREISR